MSFSPQSRPSDPFPYVDAYRSADEELDAELKVASGELPADLQGVFYNNGAGRHYSAEAHYAHPFDGDGMLKRIVFTNGRALYKNRYVRTRELTRERSAGKMLYRTFGTNIPGGLRRNLLNFRFKNASNTSVVYHAGKLLTLWEGGPPHELDPHTLQTRGRYLFDGMLRGGEGGLRERLVDPELSFSAHPLVDLETGELFNFGFSISGAPTLLCYRVHGDGRSAPVTRVPMPRRGYMHAFALSKRFCIFMVPALSFHIGPMVLGTKTLLQSLSLDAQHPTEVLLVPREGGEPVRFELPSMFVLHYANAYDDGDRVIVDGLPMGSLAPPEAFQALMRGDRTQFPFPRLVRYTFDPKRRTVQEQTLSEQPMELPTIHPSLTAKPHRYVYALTVAPGAGRELCDGVAKVDTQTPGTTTRMMPDLTYIGEPLFVPRPSGTAEDDGYLLAFGFKAREATTALVVLDARTLETCCELHLPHQIPPPFHGTFVNFDEFSQPVPEHRPPGTRSEA